jgi:peptidoglycan/xylan/chitin deacetylase (PgdA/CDA1 family)
MKNILFAICLITCTSNLVAQTKSNTTSSEGVQMLFPEGKSKALILSYDDGVIADRKMVSLMNKYKLKGTFHLNSNKLDTKGYLSKNEIKTLFKGHEVSVHSANHPGLSGMLKNEIINEVIEDRKALEKLTGYPVRGMAYPFGSYDKVVVETVADLGIEYARTVKDSYNFSIPDSFLVWHPSIHQFGKAYFNPNDPINDKKELEIFNHLVSDFLKQNALSLLDVWGHSWENDGEGERWKKIESFFKLVSNNKDINYTTHIDLVDYLHAYKNLKYSVDKKIIKNSSSMDVYIKIDGKAYKIPAGSQINI